MSGRLREFVEKKPLVVHLGVHKTATTFLQSSLKAQRNELWAQGVALLLPIDLRPAGVMRRNFGKASDDEATQDASSGQSLTSLLERLVAENDIQRIVISEENIIGTPRRNLLKRTLYPDLEQVFAGMPSSLNHPNTTFLVSLRDYGHFISSSLTTAARHGGPFDLSALRTSFLTLHRSWIDLIEEIRRGFPAATLKVWRYEDLQILQDQILKSLAGHPVRPNHKRVFKTLSGAAMQSVLEQLEAGVNKAERREMIQRAAKTYPVSIDNPPFTLWTPEEAAHLTHRYFHDWHAICERFPEAILKPVQAQTSAR